MSAFAVLETFEHTGGIVFATSNVDARRIGAGLFNDGEFGGLQVRRRKDLDCYEATGVPAAVLVADGWHFECHGCGMRIECYALEDEGMRPEGVVGFEQSAVFCCHACRMRSLADKAARDAFGQAFLDMMRDTVRRRFPNTELNFGDHRHHVYVNSSCSPLVVQEAEVRFDFPGMKIGAATLSYRHYGMHGAYFIIGPVRPEFYCCNGDREAFEAFAAATKGMAK